MCRLSNSLWDSDSSVTSQRCQYSLPGDDIDVCNKGSGAKLDTSCFYVILLDFYDRVLWHLAYIWACYACSISCEGSSHTALLPTNKHNASGTVGYTDTN